MIVYRRLVRFDDVDAARIVFFPKYLAYAHEAMEHLFQHLDGGYAGTIHDRHIGFPAVKVEASYQAPLRFGDAVDIETRTLRLGQRSATLGYRFVRVRDQIQAAEIAHTIVVTDLDALASCPMPADVRALLEAHLA